MKASTSRTNSKVSNCEFTNIQTVTDLEKQSKKFASTSNSKQETTHEPDLDSVEHVNLADDLPPASYADVGPRDYRKLHALHTSVQQDKSVRLPERNLQASQPITGSYFQKPDEENDGFGDGGIDDDDFPSPSKLLGMTEEVESSDALDVAEPIEEFKDVYESLRVPDKGKEPASSNYGDDSLDGLDADLPDLAFSPPLKQITPRGVSSFDSTKANDMFDFEAFEHTSSSTSKSAIWAGMEMAVSGSSSSHNSRKRERSSSPSLAPSKRRQDSRQEDEEPKATAPLNSDMPSWVREFDPDLINYLRDSVQFVD